MKRYLSLIVLIAFFAFGAAYIYGGPGAIVSKETVSTSVLTQMDQPVFLSLKEMTDNSDLVVLGSYTGKYVEYENDLGLDEKHIGIARRYEFVIDTVLSGDPVYSDPSTITIVKPVSYPFDYNTKDEGSYVIQIPASLQAEPDVNSRYILFVEYVPDAEFYRSIGEPWEIEITDDGLLRSGSEIFVSDSEADPKVVTLETTNRIYEINVKPHEGLYDDFISGMSLEDALAEIKEQK